MPEQDFDHAVSFAKEAGAEHLVLHTEELLSESFVSNPPDRCFYCKEELFRKLREVATAGNYKHLFDGTNADDLRDYRPGLKGIMVCGAHLRMR
jgi:uncharacterized protein